MMKLYTSLVAFSAYSAFFIFFIVPEPLFCFFSLLYISFQKRSPFDTINMVTAPTTKVVGFHEP